MNPLGLHARPAAQIVRLASSFAADIELAKDGLEVNGKSIMGVMMLAAECGSTDPHPRRRRRRRAGAWTRSPSSWRAGSGRREHDPFAPRHRRLARRGLRAGAGRAAGLPRGARPRGASRTRSRARCAGCARRCDVVVSHLNGLGERVLQRAGPEESRIFDAQIMMAQDADFLALGRAADPEQHAERRDGVRVQGARAAEPVVRRQRRLRERLADLHAIQMRMLHRLMGSADRALVGCPPDEQVIVVAHELSPGLTVQLDREHVVGLLSEEGTRTSHAAILAHSLGIPAVMGAAGALAAIPTATMLLLDGQSGTVVLDPTPRRARGGQAPRSAAGSKLELQLETVVEPARRHAGRSAASCSWATSTCPRRSSAAVRHGARRGGAAAHRVPAHRPRRPAHRGRAGRVLPPGRDRVPRAHGHHPLATTSAATSSPRRSRRRRRPTRSSAGARSASASTSRRSSGPSSAACSARRSAATCSSCCRSSHGGRGGRGPGDLLEEAGAALRRRASARRERAGGRDDRDPGGGGDRRPAGGGERVLQRRHQRPHPVHPRGGPRQRAARGAVHARSTRRSCASCSTIAARSARAAGIPVSVCGEMASEPLMRRAARRARVRAAERRAAGASAGQVGDAHRAGAGGCPRRPKPRSPRASAADVTRAAARSVVGEPRRSPAPGPGLALPGRGRAASFHPSTRLQLAALQHTSLQQRDQQLMAATEASRLHIRIGHRGPPRQGRRPDLRRGARRHPRARIRRAAWRARRW